MLGRWKDVGFDIQMDGRHWTGEICGEFKCAAEVRSLVDAGSLWERMKAKDGEYRVGGAESWVFVLDRRPCSGRCKGQRVEFSQTKFVHMISNPQE